MKKKILALCLVICLAAVALIGGTLAYFTDTDYQTNEFTVGDVEVDLWEVFDAEAAEDMVPGRKVNKDVFVENIGTNDAYVRIHMAIPTALDDGDPEYNASKNFLHWNFTKDSHATKGQWSWLPAFDENKGYDGNGAGKWNFYTTTINGIPHNVYVATYRTALKRGEVTATEAVTQIYLDASVDCEVVRNDQNEITSVIYKDNKGNTFAIDYTDGAAAYVPSASDKPETYSDDSGIFTIKFAVEATQAEGFENAYDALNTAFGKIEGKTYTKIDWSKIEPEYKQFVDKWPVQP